MRIAAVVGNAGVDPALQTRDLDFAFLGASMSGAGYGPVLLKLSTCVWH